MFINETHRSIFGVLTPSEAKCENTEITLYPKLNTLRITEDNPCLSLRIIKSEDFYVSGIQGISNNSDTVFCESVWKRFDTSSYSSADPIYAIYENCDDGCVRCTIGEKTDKPSCNGESLYVAPSQKMCFKVYSGNTEDVNRQNLQVLPVTFAFQALPR